jgi:hypothetical protein
MGEAKVRRRAHARLLAKNPGCIYCSGANRGTTVEHMPPIMMFDQRQRPNGLEFPTCDGCNHGTSLTDLVASLLGRIYPDTETEIGTRELKKLLEGVSNNAPGLLEEMLLDETEQRRVLRDIPNRPPGTTVLRANGPIITEHMRIFGAKLGLALHVELHGLCSERRGRTVDVFYECRCGTGRASHGHYQSSSLTENVAAGEAECEQPILLLTTAH